jgi:hypothetical protein
MTCPTCNRHPRRLGRGREHEDDSQPISSHSPPRSGTTRTRSSPLPPRRVDAALNRPPRQLRSTLRRPAGVARTANRPQVVQIERPVRCLRHRHDVVNRVGVLPTLGAPRPASRRNLSRRCEHLRPHHGPRTAGVRPLRHVSPPTFLAGGRFGLRGSWSVPSPQKGGSAALSSTGSPGSRVDARGEVTNRHTVTSAGQVCDGLVECDGVGCHTVVGCHCFDLRL